MTGRAAWLLVLLLATATAPLARSQAPRRTATISGVVVTIGETPQPVRGAIVRLSTTSAGPVSLDTAIGEFPTVLTDDDGRFVFEHLSAGRYRLDVTKPAFLATEFGALRPGEAGTPIAVTTDDHVTDVVVRLVRGAVITGTLRNLDGQPAANWSVFTEPRVASAPRVGFLTDDRGVYRIFGLPPGEYRVVAGSPSTFFSPGEQATTVSVQEVDAALAALERRYGPGPGMAPQGEQATNAPGRGHLAAPWPVRPLQTASVFYPGTIDESAAVKIRVEAGETRDGIDFPLVLGNTVQVAGVVVAANGQPASGAQVWVSTRSAPADANGRFRVDNVSPGHYTVTVRATTLAAALAAGRAIDTAVLRTNASQSEIEWATADVEVPPNGVSNLVLTLRPGMKLSGRVVFDAASLAPPKDLTTVTVTLASRAPVAVRPDGTFEIVGILPGTASLSASVPAAAAAGWWLRSALLDGRDLLDFPLVFDANTGDVSGVVLTFSDRHTELSGALETNTGAPTSSYVVAVLPTDRRFWLPQSRRLTFTRPATDGHYAFRDLPPGDYYLVALTYLDAGTWQEPAFLERLASAGFKVTLGEGGRTTQDLRILK